MKDKLRIKKMSEKRMGAEKIIKAVLNDDGWEYRTPTSILSKSSGIVKLMRIARRIDERKNSRKGS